MSRPTRRQYRDADRLLRVAVWRQGAHAAALRGWIADTRPAPWWRRIFERQHQT